MDMLCNETDVAEIDLEVEYMDTATTNWGKHAILRICLARLVDGQLSAACQKTRRCISWCCFPTSCVSFSQSSW